MKISEKEFSRICADLERDRASIVKHNPIGTDEEILLWMLLNTLVIYLSLSEIETPCFTGKPDASTYRDAILFLLDKRRTADFNIGAYLNTFTAAEAP